jgi:predicted RNA-binding Zn ribbon-like protein
MKTNKANIYYRDSVGGHLALDLLNTVPIVGGKAVDVFQNDGDVLNWLIENNIEDSALELTYKQDEILITTRNLREMIRSLIAARKAGELLQLDGINSFLKQGASYIQLQETDGKLDVITHREIKSVHQLLAPIAEAAVDILTQVNFDMVRKCESTDCVLWFYDRTKGHKRRWCSMAVCGNRHKVSSFRMRQTH